MAMADKHLILNRKDAVEESGTYSGCQPNNEKLVLLSEELEGARHWCPSPTYAYIIQSTATHIIHKHNFPT